MTINTDLARVQYNGNGVTTAFAFANRVTSASFLKVTRTVIATGADTPLILNDPGADGYSVSGVPGDSVTVNTIAAPATGTRITIYYDVPLTQTADYVENDPFPATTHEGALDKGCIISQQIKDAVARSFKFGLTTSTALVPVFNQAPVANAAVIFLDTNGTMGNGPSTTEIANAAANAALTAADVITTGNNVVASEAAATRAEAAAVNMKYREVRVATTVAGTLATSFENGDTIDGVVLATNDRILIKNQAAPDENGIYVVAASGAPARASDMNEWSEVTGAIVIVAEGTVNADKAWLCTSNQGGTIGVTAITFVDWSQTILDGTITNAKLASMVTKTIKANITGSTAGPTDETLTAIIDACIGSVAEGDLLYRNGTIWTRLAKGTALQTLRMNAGATAPEWATPNSGITIMPMQATTSGTTKDFTGIPAGVKRVTIMFDQISTNTGTATDPILVQIGDSGGIENSGYNSVGNWMYSASATASTGAQTTGFAIAFGSAVSGLTLSGKMVLDLMDAATNRWASDHTLGATNSNGSHSGGGSKALSATLDRVRITTLTGATFDVGNVTVSYE
jgi:hypothetical protein